MDTNYLAFGGTEVINTERLEAYVRSGLVPTGTTVDAHSECEGLQELLTPGAIPYRSPIYDKPPWYDQENPDSWDFAGVLPLEVTGLDGSTAKVEVQRSLQPGGRAGRRTWEPRTVAVSALLVGRTTASVQTGLAWLTTALHRTCVDDDTCGSTAALQGYTACPGPICRTADLDALPVNYYQDDEDPGWYVRSGFYTDSWLRPITTDDIFHDGGTPPATGGDTDDGGGVDATVPEPGGYGPVLPGEVVVDAVLGSGQFASLAGPVTITWSLQGHTGATTFTLVLLNEVGEVAVEGPTHSLGPDEVGDFTWTMPNGIDADLWRAGLVCADPDGVEVRGLTVSYQPQLTAAQCAAPYERTLPRATCVSGPTVVEVVANGDCADFLRVEWTWVVGSPFRFGHTEPLALNVRPATATTTADDYEAPGVSSRYRLMTRTQHAAYVCVPEQAPAPCYADPCAPGFSLAPLPPFIPDPDNITADSLGIVAGVPGGVLELDRMTVCLDAPAVPGNDNVLTISLRSPGQPKLGVRVRVYDAVEPDCVETSPCDFAYEFNIGYIPADGVLTIDGVTGEVTTLCQDTLQDSSSVVTGTFGGARQDPVVRCGRRYLVAVEWPHTYARQCLTGGDLAYDGGAPQGDLGVDLAVTPREG